MNHDPVAWVTRVVAVAVMAGVVAQTLAALGVTGAFGWRVATVRVAVPHAYQALDRAIDRRDPAFSLAQVRDPFEFRHAPPDSLPPSPPPRRVRPVVIADPVLTAIVWDNDPRALVRWKDRTWTIREGGLFDEFQVVSITRDQVRLSRGAVTIVLQRSNLGD